MPDCVFLLDMAADEADRRMSRPLDRMESQGPEYRATIARRLSCRGRTIRRPDPCDRRESPIDDVQADIWRIAVWKLGLLSQYQRTDLSGACPIARKPIASFRSSSHCFNATVAAIGHPHGGDLRTIDCQQETLTHFDKRTKIFGQPPLTVSWLCRCGDAADLDECAACATCLISPGGVISFDLVHG